MAAKPKDICTSSRKRKQLNVQNEADQTISNSIWYNARLLPVPSGYTYTDTDTDIFVT